MKEPFNWKRGKWLRRPRQHMGMWRYSQIAPGWQWRDGRAVKVKT